MFISSFFLQVYIGFIANYQFVATISQIGSTCIHFVTVTYILCYENFLQRMLLPSFQDYKIHHHITPFFSFVYTNRAVISARYPLPYNVPIMEVGIVRNGFLALYCIHPLNNRFYLFVVRFYRPVPPIGALR